MTTTWAQAAMTRARETLPRLQQDLDEARVHLDDLRQRQEAVQRAAAVLDPAADADLAMAVQVASELLPPMVVEAEAAVARATAARREARSNLLPAEESAWSRIAAARQADHRRGEEMSAARVRLGELQRGRAAALGVMREAGPGSNMTQLAAAEAEVRLSERALPVAQETLAVAEAAAQQARSELDEMQIRVHALRATVLGAESDEAEAALVELISLVGDDPSGWLLR